MIALLSVITVGMLCSLETHAMDYIENICPGWDESYSNAVANISPRLEGKDAERARGHLKGGMWFWNDNKDYAEIRRLVSSISDGIEGMVRVEVGNGNSQTYQSAWVVATKDAAIVVTNMRGSIRDGELTSLSSRPELVQLERSVWDELVKDLAASKVSTLRSDAHSIVADDSTYYLAFCSDHVVSQFAVYALPYGPQSSVSQKEFSRLVQNHAMAFAAVFKVLRHLPSEDEN